jgi:hypothetical protein
MRDKFLEEISNPEFKNIFNMVIDNPDATLT